MIFANPVNHKSLKPLNYNFQPGSNVRSTEPYNGIFLPRDSAHTGRLAIAGADTLLNLASKECWEDSSGEYRDIHGTLADGRKASLLQCINAGQVGHRLGEDARYESNFFPHYVVLGEQFVTSSDASIRALHYHFENVDCLGSVDKLDSQIT